MKTQHFWQRLAVALSLIFALATVAYAADVNGRIKGTVTDPSGAVLPGVQITATNVQTGVKYTAVSGADGSYLFAQLPVTGGGTYSISASAANFKAFTATGIHLVIDQEYVENITMQVGSTGQTVQVNASAVQVDTTDMQLSNVVNSEQMEELPLIGRTFTGLELTLPGVQASSDRFGGNYSVSGAQTQQSEYLINGADTNDISLNSLALSPNLDAIDQFNLIEGPLNAEYDRNSGGIVSATIKQGTNHFHGDAFEFYRDTFLNTLSYFQKKLNTTTGKYTGTVSPYHQNIFGGVVGGPIKKDKLFFFGAYQGTRQRVPQGSTSNCCSPGSSNVFSAANLAGNFSRHNYAAYFDLENDVTDKFSAGVAGRYENYSGGVGSVVSGKLSGRYQFTDTFALRATASNGFRAPSMAQVNYSSTVTLVTNGQLVQVGTLRPNDPLAIAYGAKPLSPEKSANYSVGFVFTPFDRLNATLDVYQIRIWHQILYSDPLTNTNPNFPQIAQLQFFVNGGNTRTRGADLVVNYTQELGDWGHLNNGVSANYNQVHIEEISNPALLGPYNQGLLTKGTPRTKYVLYTDWLKGGLDVHADLTRYGSVTDVSDPDIGLVGQKFSARWLLNLSANYSLQNWVFAAGVDNVTNQYPNKVALTNNGGYEDRGNGLQYSALSPFGFDGRYWYGKVTYRW